MFASEASLKPAQIRYWPKRTPHRTAKDSRARPGGNELKKERHSAIRELVRSHRVHSQAELRKLLAESGFRVTQATLSRDLRELRVAKLPHAEGESYYVVASEADEGSPTLERLLPHLLVSADGVGHILVVKTLAGGAQTVAEAIDLEEWPEVVGTVAGDDTIIMVVRETSHIAALVERLERIAAR